MPATPSQFRRPVLRSHTVDFGDGVEVAFRYDRNKITDAWYAEWQRLEGEQDANALNKALADLIESWDVVNDDGSPVPPTAENISYLFNLPDKGYVIAELMKASVPSRAEGNGSGSTSSIPVMDSTSSPGNHRPSPQPSLSPPPSASQSPT